MHAGKWRKERFSSLLIAGRTEVVLLSYNLSALSFLEVLVLLRSDGY